MDLPETMPASAAAGTTTGTGRPWRRLIAPGIAMVIGAAILCALGFWQVQRLAWKEALIAKVDARIHAAPIPAPDPSRWSALGGDDLEYQPLSVSGRFLNDKEAHVFADVEAPHGRFGGLGYFILTPLDTGQGWYVIVNRGFVPTANKDPATRAAGQIEGPVAITGLYRPVDRGNIFMPADDPKKNVWLRRDPQAIAAAIGLPPDKVAPYTLDAAFDPALPGGVPQGGETVIAFPNSHLQYAVTWFGLALALVGIFIAFARSRLKQGSPASVIVGPMPER